MTKVTHIINPKTVEDEVRKELAEGKAGPPYRSKNDR